MKMRTKKVVSSKGFGIGHALVGVIALTVMGIGVAVYFGSREAAEWESFAAQHDCVKVAHRTNVIQIWNATTKSMQPMTVGVDTFKCNDGKTYER
jgi:hypothetical protein